MVENFHSGEYILNIVRPEIIDPIFDINIVSKSYKVIMYKLFDQSKYPEKCYPYYDENLKNLSWAKYFKKDSNSSQMIEESVLNQIKSDLNRIEKLIAFQ